MEDKEAYITDYLKELQTLSSKTYWTVLMCSGGHFAGAVFDKNTCVKHKGFHVCIKFHSVWGISKGENDELFDICFL